MDYILEIQLVNLFNNNKVTGISLARDSTITLSHEEWQNRFSHINLFILVIVNLNLEVKSLSYLSTSLPGGKYMYI